MASVGIRNVYKSFGATEVIHGIEFDIADKELVVLVGPSGCGKSTLLRMIAGLEDITAGEIEIGDRVVNRVAAKDRNIAMVFQSYALYPHMTVYRNMSFGLRMRKIPKDEQDRRIRWAAEVLELTDYLRRYPRQLSGGQRQRVAMGRALVREPIVFLFDEPLSNLDAQLRVQMRTEIRELHQRLQTTMIYVTHDQVEAMTLADRIVVMNDGHIEQIGAPEHVYDRPANTFVAGFIGSPQMNMLPGTLGPDGTIALEGGVTVRHDQALAAEAGRKRALRHPAGGPPPRRRGQAASRSPSTWWRPPAARSSSSAPSARSASACCCRPAPRSAPARPCGSTPPPPGRMSSMPRRARASAALARPEAKAMAARTLRDHADVVDRRLRPRRRDPGPGAGAQGFARGLPGAGLVVRAGGSPPPRPRLGMAARHRLVDRGQRPRAGARLSRRHQRTRRR